MRGTDGFVKPYSSPQAKIHNCSAVCLAVIARQSVTNPVADIHARVHGWPLSTEDPRSSINLHIYVVGMLFCQQMQNHICKNNGNLEEQRAYNSFAVRQTKLGHHEKLVHRRMGSNAHDI